MSETTACSDESECTYEPFCRLNSRCMRLTAVGPVKVSKSLRHLTKDEQKVMHRALRRSFVKETP